MEGMPVSQTAYPASFGQQRLWFLDQLEPGTAAYNVARAFRITGPLDIAVLTRAFEAIVRRHESLRTVFDSELQSLLNRMLEGGQPAWRRAVGSERVFLCA